MEKIKLEIVGISYSQSQSGAYALVLGEIDGERRLPIIIGGFEAQAIAVELEKMKPARPLTHDLLKNLAKTFRLNIEEVIIHDFNLGIFYAKLTVSNENGEIHEIDARTSDAVALALRFNCPIFTTEKVMTVAGIKLSDTDEEDEETEENNDSVDENNLKDYTVDELQEMLQSAIDNEEFEKASLIRDELKNREV